jgi:hypothetical protein
MKSFKELPLIGTGFQHLIDSYSGTCPLHLSGSASSSWTGLTFLRTSGRRRVMPLLQNTTFPTLANSSRKVSRLGFRLICSRMADPRRCLFRKVHMQSSWLIRGGVLPGCYCCGAMARCMALMAVPCGWMRLSINSTKLDKKSACTDDCPKQNK